MSSQYFETIQLIERLHRYFLDVVKTELDRKGLLDINNVQAMILHNIGSDEMTVGNLPCVVITLVPTSRTTLKK